MDSNNLIAIEKLLMKNARKHGMTSMRLEKNDNIVPLYYGKENFHLFYTIKSEQIVNVLNLQFQVELEENGIRTLVFVDPIVLRPSKIGDASKIANAVNARLKGLGRFTVHETGDFLFDVYFPIEMIYCTPEIIEDTIFTECISFFRNLHIPLFLYAEGFWDIDIAVEFIEELFDNGFVDNFKYGFS